MTSMTGYAYKEVSTPKANISVEIKSVNSRYLDLNVNLPSFLGRLENRFRAEVTDKILRGKVDVNIRVHEFRSDEKVSADVETAKAYALAIGDIARAIGKDPCDIPLSLIVSQEGVLSVERTEDVEVYWDLIHPVFKDAFEQFITDRAREGANLYHDLSENYQNSMLLLLFLKNGNLRWK